jgi:glutathione S-transferase
MTLTIYGSPRSRTMRVLWAAEELGLSYRHEPYAWDDPGLKEPAFLAINPAGTIPAIDDDGFRLGESLAILLYLAKRYGDGAFYPADITGEAEVWRWSLWAQGHLEPWVQQDALLAEVRAAMGGKTNALIANGLERLDGALAAQAWLVGDGFSVVDLCVAGILSPSRASRIDLAPFPNVGGWLDRCYGRPAAVAVRSRFAA